MLRHPMSPTSVDSRGRTFPWKEVWQERVTSIDLVIVIHFTHPLVGFIFTTYVRSSGIGSELFVLDTLISSAAME